MLPSSKTALHNSKQLHVIWFKILVLRIQNNFMLFSSKNCFPELKTCFCYLVQKLLSRIVNKFMPSGSKKLLSRFEKKFMPALSKNLLFRTESKVMP